jgi:hypothetical protein
MAISLTKIFAGISDYVSKHEVNYTTIETSINDLLTLVSGSSSTSVVPTGLREIFDRNGVIGIASFQLTNQTVVADQLTIPAGASWMNLAFASQTSGTILDTSALTTGTRYVDIDSAGILGLSDTQTSASLYSFAWNSSTKVITVATLLVAVLFDGNDYADSLDSVALAATYTSMADRFEAIEVSLGVLGALYGQDNATTTGLTFGYKAGSTRNDNVVATTAAGTIAMTDNDVNYIEVNPTTGVITTNITGFTTGLIPLFTVTAASAAITVVLDHRTWASLGGGGGGGGSHTQNTDTGTTSEIFTLNNDEAGTPSLNGTLEVERGTSPNAGLRFNETTDTWQQNIGDGVWTELAAPDLGVQELCKFVSFEDPPLVVNISAQSDGGAYVPVDLTLDADFTSIVSGVQGMLLRVQMDDSAADANSYVLFKKIEDGVDEPAESMRVFAKDSADFDDEEGSVILTPGQGLDMSGNFVIGFDYQIFASGAATANLKVYVLGYWDKVTGVGTQDQAFSSVGNAIPNGTTNFNLTGAWNRGLVNKITIEETSGTPTAVYHIKIFDKDTFAAGVLRYHVTDVDPASDFVDRRVIMIKDLDDTAELHIQIENTDASTGTITITMEVERLA